MRVLELLQVTQKSCSHVKNFVNIERIVSHSFCLKFRSSYLALMSRLTGANWAGYRSLVAENTLRAVYV